MTGPGPDANSASVPARVRIVDDFGGVPEVRLAQAIDPQGASIPGPRLALVACQHGNEPVGAQVLERFVDVAEQHLVAGSVLLVLANLDARALDVRHTPDGIDMNRLWDAVRLDALAAADPADLCSEERRVRELAPVVQTADAVLDLHSTSRPSPTHLLLRDDLRHATVAARLGVTRLVTGVHENAILDGGLCSNLGLRAGLHGPRLGFTLEAGQHMEPANLERAWKVVVRLLVELGLWVDEADDPTPVAFEVYDVIERFRQAPAGAPSWAFVGYEGGPAGAGRVGPPRELASFEVVEADETVLRRSNGEIVRAEAPFSMLMPAPTAGPGEDLFYFTQRRYAALASRPSSDEQARTEAAAIERMLNLVAWDEAQRGTTWVSVTSRRTLDLCADLVARTARLPEGHPHRRITIVGRGDWGGDEAEQRAGVRWAASVREARRQGVTVERIQLLRGASLGWLDALVRGAATDGEPLQICLSTRQPHTVSAVVVGDPTEALTSGEFRHVGVAILIEAATVEADGDEVHVRVARAGLFGARPELLRAAIGLVRALRAEHAHTWLDPELDAIGRTRRPGGAFRPSSPAEARALADAVRAYQVRRWRDALARVVPSPMVVERGRLGAWLARVMVATGILDAEVLQAWLVEPDAAGWRVDPTRLASDPSVASTADPRRALPIPALSANQVDRDNIERWMGWKRFLREVQALPGTRGRHLDIAFDAATVQRRVARWMDEARAAAEREPDRWLVAIAGDGLSPRRDRAAEGWDVLWAHRRLLLDPNLRYLRVQHAQGTHLAWMKDFVGLVAERPEGGAPVAMGWETEHGGSVNVMLVARRPDTERAGAWSLEPWTVERCTVLVSDSGGAHDYQVALFTERDERGAIHQELVHFGRAHCERLLRQASWRYAGPAGRGAQDALNAAGRALVADQVRTLAAESDKLAAVPEAEQATWATQRLGLLDPALAARAVDAVVQGLAPEEAGRRIWEGTEPWPGTLWREVGRID